MLYLGLLRSYCLNELSLLLEIGVADQLRMVHLDHLELLSRCEFLLHQSVSLPCMRQLDLRYLSHEPFFILSGLFRSDFLRLVGQFE